MQKNERCFKNPYPDYTEEMGVIEFNRANVINLIRDFAKLITLHTTPDNNKDLRGDLYCGDAGN